MYSPYTNTRDASDVIYRNDYRTRYFGYYGKLQNTVNAIINIVGGSGGANEGSELAYLYTGRLMITDEELRAIFGKTVSSIPPVIITSYTIWYNPSTTPLSTITLSGVTYMVDGSSTLYWLNPNGTYVFTDTITPCLIGLAVDSSGALYIVDSANSKIYKWSPPGPPGPPGPVDLHITGLVNPTKVVVSPTGVFFILEDGASTIKTASITAYSAATVIAGSTLGFADGVGTSTMFNKPMGFVLDSTGTFLYITDTGNSLIRKMVTSTYTVSTIVGSVSPSFYPTDSVGNRDGVGINGECLVYQPKGITISPSGIIYFADSSNNNIRKISLDGTVTTIGGMAGLPPVYDISPAGYIDAPNTLSRWNMPTDIQYYNNLLIITEPLNHDVRVLPII